MPFNIGIDLGTTYCTMSRIDPETGKPVIIKIRDDEHIIPSAVYFENGLYSAGLEAKEMFEAGDVNCAVFFKRMMGEKENGKDSICFIAEKGTVYERGYSAVELSVMLLQHLKEEAEAVIGDTINEAVITCPAYFFDKERSCIMRAAATAGLQVRELLEEPTAAALTYGLRYWNAGARILVYDLGGGTFDITVVEMDDRLAMSAIGTEGVKFLGGTDFDEALLRVILRELSDTADIDLNSISESEMSVIRGEVENTKIKLSDLQSTRVSAIVGGKKITVEITRNDFELECKDILEDTGRLIDKLLKDKLKISPKDITDVLLVGGSTLMPCVRAFVANKFNKPPLTHANPATAVSIGAAMRTISMRNDDLELSGSRKGKTKESSISLEPGKAIPPASFGDLELKRTATHTMGVIAVSSDGEKYINEPIIIAGSKIPAKYAKTLRFATKSDGSSVVDIYMLQGDNERPLDNSIEKRCIATGLRHSSDGRTYIRIQYEYNQSGLIKVRVRQENDNIDLPIKEYDPPADMLWTDYPPMRENTTNSNQRSNQAINLLLFFDTSYSMHDGPERDAQAAAKKLVTELHDNNPNASVGIGVVANKAIVLLSPTNNSSQIFDAINSIESYVSESLVGVGNKGQPFDEIYKSLNHLKGERIAIVLADGIWDDDAQVDAVKSSKKCNSAGIETIGVGFGSADEGFLHDISSKTDFEFSTFVQNSGELVELFGNLAQSLGANSELPIAEVWE